GAEEARTVRARQPGRRGDLARAPRDHGGMARGGGRCPRARKVRPSSTRERETAMSGWSSPARRMTACLASALALVSCATHIPKQDAPRFDVIGFFHGREGEGHKQLLA